ncbi:Transcriptional regulator, GntR family [Pseudonocardia sp. Ae707_Ps1]|nr:Transcriptional regulator, GntR family [Pseudonocardia sp. Ae707_Ps1]
MLLVSAMSSDADGVMLPVHGASAGTSLSSPRSCDHVAARRWLPNRSHFGDTIATMSVIGDPTRAAEGTGAVQRAAASIRELVMKRQLVPGQQVRQEDLSQQISISRGPIREALQILQADGVVAYERNRGYFVSQFSADEMRQLYLARDLLETAVLSELGRPTDEQLAELTAVNEGVRAAGLDVDQIMRGNDAFHSLILNLSDQRLLVAEIDRVWRMSVAYRALSVSVLNDSRVVAEEHDEMLHALRSGDGPELAELWRSHRQVSLNRLLPILR